MTANSSDEESTACRDAGMDGFLPKPFGLTASHNALQTLGIPTPHGPLGDSGQATTANGRHPHKRVMASHTSQR